MWRVWVDTKKKIAYFHKTDMGVMMEFRTETCTRFTSLGLLSRGTGLHEPDV